MMTHEAMLAKGKNGNLSLYGCTSLTHLPEGLVVNGDLNLSDCTSLTHLPEGLVVNDSLDLYYCTSLTHLPEGLVVNGSLSLYGCNLTNIYRGGKDSRGYQFYGVKLKNGKRIIAGCRNFSKTAARKHWPIKNECRALAEDVITNFIDKE